MPRYTILSKKFEKYMKEYVEYNGNQPVTQIKQLAKQFATDSRNGIYDISARKRYYYIFITYCYDNDIEIPDNLEFMTMNMYDPDNEFPNDPAVIRGKKKLEEVILRDVNILLDRRHGPV